MAGEREHETEAAPPAPPAAAAAIAAVAPIGNRATGALLARRPGRGVAHPRLAAVIARRQLARAPTREEMIAAFDRELAAATDGTGTWKDVALRLNGFDKADIARMCAKMTLPQLQSTRAAVERELEGWPVAHLLAGLDGAAAQKGRGLRPQSKSIWEAYKQVGYNRWSGEPMKNMVWEHVGGSVGSGFAGENTCATRVSWGFNYGGWAISGAKSGWSYRNDPKVTYKGKAGDDKRYIVSAPYMAEFLEQKWGKPDARLKTNDEVKAFEATLAAGEVAIFAGPHHSGLIMQGYDDAYAKTDPGVMPIVAWRLPH